MNILIFVLIALFVLILIVWFVYKNKRKYGDLMDPVSILDMDVEKIKHPEHCFNPSIIKDQEGFRLLSRKHTGIWNETYSSILDVNFNILTSEKLTEHYPINAPAKYYNFNTEDIRIFRWNQQLWYLGNIMDYNPKFINEMILFNDDFSVLLKYKDSQRQKNWTPFIDNNNQLLLIYSFSPYIILKPNLKTGECVEIIHQPFCEKLLNFNISKSHLRGSTPLLSLKNTDELLGIAHIIYNTKNYIHVFYKIKNFYPYEIIAVSKLYKFNNAAIEFPMALEYHDDDFIVSYGVNDLESYIGKISTKTIENIFK